MLELKKEKNEVLPNLSDHFPFNEKSMWTVKEAKKSSSPTESTFLKRERPGNLLKSAESFKVAN